jgi:protein involved in polysaccharide export with SLBB domain
MVDLTSIATTLLALASAAVAAAIPVLVPALMKRWKISNETDLGSTIENALQAAAGLAYKTGVDNIAKGGLANIQVHNAAVAAGMNYMNTQVPGKLAALGITPEEVREKVTARLGSAMASDPTVTAVAPVAVRTV